MCAREASVRLAAWSCVLLAVVCADSEINVYGKLGGEVLLKPGNASVTAAAGAAAAIWTHDQNIAIDFDGAETVRYRQFKERGSLNPKNGEMTITGLTRSDSGLYTCEVNGVLASPNLRLLVISAVPKPTVGKSCDEESCTLTCDGDTAGAGPVTFRWRSDGESTTGSQALHITKDGSSGFKEFSCELENPVGRERSQPVPNPLASTSPGGKLNVSTGVTVFIALLVAVLLLVAVHRFKTGMWFFQKTSMPWEPNFWRKNEMPPRNAAASNGTSAQENGQIDEETPLS
ncbi:sialoadhesin-like isoform X2 [Cyclopterus lumpus]|uniref:Ig-like domain-containing protein n=1 Tax=Cyclopterus lumpus TaxID=8103 RepID=A0A8C2WNJ4_CYCLU|nr:sialoadhesin-like isoform X2 [Cyclopterus lumpus]